MNKHRLMSTAMYHLAKTILFVTQACWDWYTWQVKHVKTPYDNLRYLQRMVSWRSDAHLKTIVRTSLFTHAHLDSVCLQVEDQSSEGSTSKRSEFLCCFDIFWRSGLGPLPSTVAHRNAMHSLCPTQSRWHSRHAMP